MFKGLFKSLNIEQGEETRVVLLIVQSFFIGIFFATIEISASSLFMSEYGKDMLGKAYLISGLLGIVLTGIYSKLQDWISFSKLAVLNLLFISVASVLMWMSFDLYESEWLVFGIFILMGPLYILALVAFSGMASRMFTLRQGKRLFGIIDSGQIFGMILISLVIPVVIELIPATKDLILISAVGITMSLILQLIISSKFDLNQSDVKQEAQEVVEKVKVGIGIFFKNRYVMLMSLFVILSMIAAFFTSYNFLTVTQINYPEEKDFAAFFAKFFVAVMAFSFVIKTFIYSKLTKTYGLKINLILVPVLIGFFVIVSATVGSFADLEKGTASFTIFFLLITLVRFFAMNLKDSIQTPSVKLLFQPIDAKIRFNIQARVEGVINEFAAVTAGLILALLEILESLEVISLINYSHILTIIAAAWVYVTIKLYNEYQSTLRKSLEGFSKDDALDEGADGDAHISEGVEHDDAFKYALNLTRKYQPIEFEKRLTQLLRDKKSENRHLAITSIHESKMFSAMDELESVAKNDSNADVKKYAGEVLKSFNELLTSKKSIDEIALLAKSKDAPNRAIAAKIIGFTGNHDLIPLLRNLIKDLDPQVKMAAIGAIVRFNHKEMWPLLVDLLSDNNYKQTAKAAIVSIGEPMIDLLEKAFYKSGAKLELFITIVEIYGLIGGEKAEQHLIDKISYPQRKVVLEALAALRVIGFSTENEKVLNQIFTAIEQNIGITAWNIASFLDVGELGLPNQQLERALEDEITANINLIFELLSLAYDPKSIKHIRDNIELGSTEGVSFAIEMLDLFIVEQLKGTLFPLLEDNSLEQKFNELELHFAVNRSEGIEVLNKIINRSSNYLSNYTKACAIMGFIQVEYGEVNQSLIANLFNPDPIIRETTALVMNALDNDVLKDCMARLSESDREQVEEFLNNVNRDQFAHLFDKLSFLKTIPVLSKLHFNELEEIALRLKRVVFEPNKEMLNPADEKAVSMVFFIEEGEVTLESGSGKMQSFGPTDVVGEMMFLESDQGETKFKAIDKVTCYQISRSELYELIFQFPELANILPRILESRFADDVAGK